MTDRRYAIKLKPLGDALGGGWVAVVPDLPGFRSDGETPQEALQNAFDAIHCWIEAAGEMGREVPSPCLV